MRAPKTFYPYFRTPKTPLTESERFWRSDSGESEQQLSLIAKREHQPPRRVRCSRGRLFVRAVAGSCEIAKVRKFGRDSG